MSNPGKGLIPGLRTRVTEIVTWHFALIHERTKFLAAPGWVCNYKGVTSPLT